MPINLITDSASLVSFCRQLQVKDREGFITVDTEFIREETFWPKLCLVQVAGSQEAAIIDACAPGMDFTPLFELMADPQILKVFHAARQDLEIFFYLSKTIPKPIFDTQVAAMVCGFGDSVAYDNLVQSLAHATIDKSSRFTDWGKRPLTDKQLTYALQDVTYLRIVYEHLKHKLDKAQRSSWIKEEMAILENPQTYAISPQDAWKRIKTRTNAPRFLARVQALAALREDEAVSQNVPRNRIVRDQVLLEIAAHPPKNFQEAAHIRGMPPHLLSGEKGARFLNILAQAEALPLSECPHRLRQPLKTAGTDALVELLKVWLKHACHIHNVAQKLVANSSDLEQIAASNDADISVLKGWRYEIFGRDAIALKEGRAYVTVQNNKLSLVTHAP